MFELYNARVGGNVQNADPHAIKNEGVGTAWILKSPIFHSLNSRSLR
jgi:hypothetical protein